MKGHAEQAYRLLTEQAVRREDAAILMVVSESLGLREPMSRLECVALSHRGIVTAQIQGRDRVIIVAGKEVMRISRPQIDYDGLNINVKLDIRRTAQ